MITLTESAAKELLNMKKETGDTGEFLRLAVEEGGCSGHEYGMGFDDPQEGDVRLESAGIKMVVDPESLKLLKGITIDFNDGLHGKGFEIKNPNAKNSCGCGKSFN